MSNDGGAEDQMEATGQPAAPKSIEKKDWVYEDFFAMTGTEELTVKKAIAQQLGIPYGQVNRKDDDDEFATTIGGIPAFTVNRFTAGRDKFKAALATNDPAQIRSTSNISMVVNGCLLRWKPPVAINEGYVKDWGQRNLHNWDSSIERRAAPSADDPAFMYFSASGVSSLLAMIAQVVFEFKTGTIDEKLSTAFKQVRLNVCFNASGDEIALIGQCDNIEQSLRRKHSEMDNILAVLSWHQSMEVWSSSLKSGSALDLMRFACCLVDPRSFETTPEWLTKLLNGKLNTMANRVVAVANSNVTKRWLTDNKVKPAHPQMNSYEALALRHRFVKGFTQAKFLYKTIFGKMGLLGKAHMPSPLPKAVLLDPAILTSAGFTLQKEKETVPSWRDGAAGEQLQQTMVLVAETRYVDYNFHETGAPVFANGARWAAFARLVSPVENVLSNLYGPMPGWPDSLKAVHREMWRGEHDADIAALCLQLPGHLDSQALQARVQEQLRFLSRKIADLSMKTQNAVIVSNASVSSEILKDQAVPKSAGSDLKENTVMTGNLGEMTPQQLQAHTNKLNSDAICDRNAAIKHELQRFAADVYRSKVAAFSKIEEAKAYMETGGAGVALVARTMLIDVTMPKDRQTGPKSRSVCAAPSKELQKEWASHVKMIPVSPVIGHVLIRPALHGVEQLNLDLKTTHAHVRQIMVPIDVPTSLLGAIKSGVGRAKGPGADDASGVDFVMRTIGRAHTSKKSAGGSPTAPIAPEIPADPQTTLGIITDLTEAELEDAADEEDDEEIELSEGAPVAFIDPATMSMKQLTAKYGDQAIEISKMFFQHSSRIAAHAMYLKKANALMVKPNERADPRHYRKGQLHPSAFYSLFTSALSSTSEELRPHEALVILTGGTPEAASAGIAAGFQKVIYVTGDPVEVDMMKLPDDLSNIDFERRCGGLR